jgi:hypothetical protein
MKHYPYLDKELDIAGIEAIDAAVIVAISIVLLVIGLFAFNLIVGLFLFVSTLVILYVYMRRLKQNKERGYIARKISKFFRGNEELY